MRRKQKDSLAADTYATEAFTGDRRDGWVCGWVVKRYADGNGAFAESKWLAEDIRRNFTELPWVIQKHRPVGE